MGTKVQFDNHLPGYYSMRDLNHDANDASWPGYYGENNLPYVQCYYGVLPKPIEDAFPGYNKDLVKQTMLRHEAIFKSQVFELHRLYRVQKDLMDEVMRKDQHRPRIPFETSSSSSALPSQIPSEDSQRRYSSSFLLANSSCGGGPQVSGPEINQSSSIGNTLKGKSVQASPIPLRNCSSPKHSEASESRPTKVRRKLLDLQLPADEYIDTDEAEQYGKEPVSNHCEKTNYQDGSRSDPSLRKPSALADLNDLVQSEEATVNPSWEVLGASKLDVSAKFHGWSKDGSWSSNHGNVNGATANLQYDSSKVDGTDWLSPLKTEVSKGAVTSTHQGSQPEKAAIPSQSVQQVLFEKQCQPLGFFPQNHHVKEDPLPVKSSDSFKRVERNHSSFSYHNAEPVLVSNHLNLPSPSSELADLWDHSVSSWSKPSGCFSQKSISVHTIPFHNSASLRKSSQSTAQNNEFFRNRWNVSSNPSVNIPGFKTDPPLQNELYNDSSSGYRESSPFPLSKVGFSDYVNGKYNDKIASGSSNNLLKGTTSVDLNLTRDLNLNMVPPSGLSASDRFSQPQQSIKIIDGESMGEDHPPALPWLRAKDVSSTNGSVSARDGLTKPASGLFQGSYEPLNRSELKNAPDCQNSNASASCDFVDVRSDGHSMGDYLSGNGRKILGVPIHQKPGSQEEDIQSGRRKPVFDINMPCDPLDHDFGSKSTGAGEGVVVKQKPETSLARGMIDLNLCIEADEVPLRASVADGSTPTTSSTKRVGRHIIDLEAPVDLEAEDDEYIVEDQELLKNRHQLPSQELSGGGPHCPEEDKIARVAAEAIVAISSFSFEQNHAEEILRPLPIEESFTPEHPLRWFVDIISSHPDVVEAQPDSRGHDGDKKGCMLMEYDDFESLTLRLTGVGAEEYLSKPSAFDIPLVAEDPAPTPVLTGRPRRGPARRGRQRRDFQRDILPSLASLSRHEVTEDLQTFGGLMLATGHAWQCGSRRNAARNGSGRGRRRSVVAIAPHAAANAAAPATANNAVNTTAAIATACATPPKRFAAAPATANAAVTTTAAIATACATPPKRQQVKNGEVRLEDRSLTSWGKTTRRPRRPRCPPPSPVGNPTIVPLT